MSDDNQNPTIADSFQVAGDIMIHAVTDTVKAINPFTHESHAHAQPAEPDTNQTCAEETKKPPPADTIPVWMFAH